MFYYTPQFLSVVPDVEGYIDDMLATANAGFANSQVDVTVHKFCLAEASIDEILDTSEMLVRFRNTFGRKSLGLFISTVCISFVSQLKYPWKELNF